MNIEKLEKLLKNSYKKETAYLPYQDKWSKENPTCGQCAITSLIVQKYFGGTIHRIKLNNGDIHYFNIVNEQIIELIIKEYIIIKKNKRNVGGKYDRFAYAYYLF